VSGLFEFVLAFLREYTTFVIVGNMIDLVDEKGRAVSFEEGKRQAQAWKATFMEISAADEEVTI